MGITLNKNSISAILYRFFYGVEKNEMPSNLCPYFWKLVLMFIFIIPYTIFTLPYKICTKFEKNKLGESIGISFILNGGLIMCFLVLIFIIDIFIPLSSNWDKYVQLGIFCGMLILSFGIIILVNYINKKVTLKQPQSINIVKEFISAKYNKYCPKITWNNEK